MTTVRAGADGAAEPVLSRRHAAGAQSARGLLFTVLGEFVLPAGGVAWTSSLIDVLGRLGVEPKTTRQALMRTAADGWLTSRRVGRRASWQLTSDAERLLVDGTQRIYGFTGTTPNWDGRWLMVLARTPETDRPARHLLRTRLSWAGLGSPAPGVWISPHPDRLGEVERVLAAAGVGDDAQVFVAEHRGGAAPATMVRQAWDLAAIEDGYEDFIDTFSAGQARDPLAGTAALVHAWRRFPWVDPVLPPELLPTPWRGVEAARLFIRLHAEWSAHATADWRRLNESPPDLPRKPTRDERRPR